MSFKIDRKPASGILVNTQRRNNALKLIALGVVFFVPFEAQAQSGIYYGSQCPDGYMVDGEYCYQTYAGSCNPAGSMIVAEGTCEMSTGQPACAVQCTQSIIFPGDMSCPPGQIETSRWCGIAVGKGAARCNSQMQMHDSCGGYPTCAVDCAPAALPPASCTAPWGAKVNHGSSVTAFASGSVACGSTCQSQSRTCNNGTLSGTYTASACSVQACPPANCNGPWGTVNHGTSITAYASGSVPCGSACQSQTRSCTNGTLSGSYTASSCSVQACPPANCNGPWGTVNHGASITAYASNSVACGSSCQSQVRSCTNGTLSGSYTASSCSVQACPPANCNGPWGTVNHGTSIIAYAGASVPCGSSCQSQVRTCTNGTLSGTYTVSACSVATCPPPPPPGSACGNGGGVLTPAYHYSDWDGPYPVSSNPSCNGSNHGTCCSASTPIGARCISDVVYNGSDTQCIIMARDCAGSPPPPPPPPPPPANCSGPSGTVNHGTSITTYAASSVPCGSSCQSQIRTCVNGSLSGSYAATSCSVAACPPPPPSSCNGPWGTVNHGASITAYASNSVACGSSCQSQVRTCTNGTLSGSYTAANCSVGICCNWIETSDEQLWCPGPGSSIPGSPLPAVGSSCSSAGQTITGTQYSCTAPGGAHETRTSYGRYCLCEGGAVPPPPPSLCSGGNQSWVAGSHTCNANVPPLGHGDSTMVYDNGAPTTGSATYSCSNGSLTASSRTCVRQCDAGTVNWSEAGTTCSAYTGVGANGTNTNVTDSTHDNTGSAVFYCNNGGWQFSSGNCAVPPACPAQAFTWTNAQGKLCRGSVGSVTPHRSVLTINDPLPLYTGSANFRCFAGSFEAPTSATCVPSCSYLPSEEQDPAVPPPDAAESCLMSRMTSDSAGCGGAQCGPVYLYEVLLGGSRDNTVFWQYQSTAPQCDKGQGLGNANCDGVGVFYKTQTDILGLRPCG